MAAFIALWIATPRVVTCFSQGVNQSAQGSDKVSDNSKPSVEFSSSTSPMASIRCESLATREPSPKPVVPVSPVRVTILDNR